ncbi:hypothetical protein Tco_0520416 [Tanacetum coccineum]
MGTVRFRNDHFAAITGYGDYVQGNLMICHIYYVEGLGHNLFSVGQFCAGDLEVAFLLNMCYDQNLEGDDLLTGSRDSNLYTISISEMAASSRSCLMSRVATIKEFLFMAPQTFSLEFCPLYEEYYKTSSTEVLDNSAANTIDNDNTSSSSSIVVEEDEVLKYVAEFDGMFVLHCTSNSLSTIEPKNIKEAVLDASWIETMKDELSQFKRLDVWELVKCPIGRNIIVKRIDLRSLLHQLRDLKLSEFYGIRGSQELSYLPNGRQNGIPKQSTERGRFVRHPDGFVDPDFPNHLYRLKKALYGLK